MFKENIMSEDIKVVENATEGTSAENNEQTAKKVEKDPNLLLKEIHEAIRHSVSLSFYEKNDEATRIDIRKRVERVMKKFRDSGDIFGFQIFCDANNNPEKTIKKNILVLEYGVQIHSNERYRLFEMKLTPGKPRETVEDLF